MIYSVQRYPCQFSEPGEQYHQRPFNPSFQLAKRGYYANWGLSVNQLCGRFTVAPLQRSICEPVGCQVGFEASGCMTGWIASAGCRAARSDYSRSSWMCAGLHACCLSKLKEFHQITTIRGDTLWMSGASPATASSQITGILSLWHVFEHIFNLLINLHIKLTMWQDGELHILYCRRDYNAGSSQMSHQPILERIECFRLNKHVNIFINVRQLLCQMWAAQQFEGIVLFQPLIVTENHRIECLSHHCTSNKGRRGCVFSGLPINKYWIRH